MRVTGNIMTFISVTRLRLRAIRFLPGFAMHAIRTRNQVRQATGFEAGALLPDHDWTFWTMTAWTDEASMRRYVMGGAHRSAMPSLVRWCDEASVVHWTQADTVLTSGSNLPPWEDADRRMRADGHPSKVRHPSPRHLTMTYRPPRLTRSGPIRAATAGSEEPARH